MKKKSSLVKLVTAAVFAALTCVATMVISIPIPATRGYVNVGDSVVLIGAFLLGPYYGAAAGALGSALADLFLGYAYFAPGTFLIKGLMALIAALIFSALRDKTKLPFLPAAAAGELWMVLGYFLYESALLGYGAAALGSVPSNLIQAAGGAVIACVLFRALIAVPEIRRFTEKEG